MRALALLLLLPACPKAAPPLAPEPGEAVLLLHLNDTYRAEGLPDARGGFPRVRTLREQRAPDLLLHAGDLLYPSLPSRCTAGHHQIAALNALDGDAQAFDPRLFVTFGNHEFDTAAWQPDCAPLTAADKTPEARAAALDREIEASQFTWLSANVRFAAGPDGQPLVAAPHLLPRALVDVRGVRVGLFGVTGPLEKPPAYVAEVTDPVEAARAQTAALRAEGAQLVVAITHLDAAEDLALLRALGPDGPDAVFGGHDHNAMHEVVDGRSVYKSDADATTAWLVALRPGAPDAIEAEKVSLDAAVAPDPALEALVRADQAAFSAAWCAARHEAADCLDRPVGRVNVPIVAEELRIRRYETNLGDLVADRSRAAWPDTDVALVNSGGLRLNHDLPAGYVVTARTVEELFAYDAPLTRLQVTGQTVIDALNRSVKDWTGQGHFLQVSGVAFRFDPATGAVTDVTRLADDGPRPLDPTEPVTLTVPTYLAGGGDGYDMLKAATVLDRGTDDAHNARTLFVQALRDAGEAGLSPAVDGRICNAQVAGPCLAVAR